MPCKRENHINTWQLLAVSSNTDDIIIINAGDNFFLSFFTHLMATHECDDIMMILYDNIKLITEKNFRVFDLIGDGHRFIKYIFITYNRYYLSITITEL